MLSTPPLPPIGSASRRLAIVCKVHCSLYDSSREGIEERFEHVRDGVRRILDAQVQLRSGN